MTPLVDRREQAEKEHTWLRTPGGRFAYWLSSPFVVGLGVFL